jgi:hypothetical protein
MACKVEPFVTRHISQVDAVQPQQHWLIEPLWFVGGVGVLGGHAKVCKTYLAAELAVAVASGQPALGRLPSSNHGPVLFYGAEDPLPMLSGRFDGLAQVRALNLEALPIYLLDVPVLRLDRQDDQNRLRAAIESISPRLLVLDPLVRVAKLDENSAAEVSALLGFLRAMQRAYDLAVLVIHHARKSPASHHAHALRGSTDFAAWSDTNLFLSRKGQLLTLQIEHRFAPPPAPLTLRLESEPAPHLAIADTALDLDTTDSTRGGSALLIADDQDPLQLQIFDLLCVNRCLPTVTIRERVRKRKQDVVAALNTLATQGKIERGVGGWKRSSTE